MDRSPERVLIHAPYGRDAALLQKTLERAQVATHVCVTLDELCGTLQAGAGALLISDEALGGDGVRRLSAAWKEQPAWSDLPLLVMTNGGEATSSSRRRLELLAPLDGPTTLLERPLRVATLVSTVHTALRARRRQYQIRDLLEAQTRSATELTCVNQALSKSNEDLTHFAYSASHDLKEPLRNVAAYAQLLGRKYRGQLDHQGDDFIGAITDGVRRMQQLIEDLLSYSQVTTSTRTEELRADSNEAREAALQNLSLMAKETNAQITSETLPAVAVDPTQLTQLFQNLLSNALKYRKPHEAPRIAISATPHESLWEFSIVDNGVGFEQQNAELVFGIFKRLHGKDVPGTGIGLAMCKRIVEHYRGEIWATSQPGKGATFSFTLPAGPPSSDPA